MHLNTMKDKHVCGPLGSYTEVVNAFVYICTSFVTSHSEVTNYCPWADVRTAQREWFLQFYNKALSIVGRVNVKKQDAPCNKWAATANCFRFWWLQCTSRVLSTCRNVPIFMAICTLHYMLSYTWVVTCIKWLICCNHCFIVTVFWFPTCIDCKCTWNM